MDGSASKRGTCTARSGALSPGTLWVTLPGADTPWNPKLIINEMTYAVPRSNAF